MTNLIWWSSQAFKLSPTMSPLVSKEAGILDAAFIFSLYLSARRCFFTYMDWVIHDFDGWRNTIRLTVPGFKSDDIKVLSSSESKIGVWRVYEAACVASDAQAVSYRKFLQLWDQFHPNVVISKPATDLFHLSAKYKQTSKSCKPLRQRKVGMCPVWKRIL